MVTLTNYILFDSSSDEERGWADWKPKFDVQIASSDVAVFKINAVSYEMIPEAHIFDWAS
ncbi:hypothetical protein SAMN04515620_11428 [Collimonas sp. OK607]|uniref:hypothetical protein n=1 Tax=Collimonas sp. OK607 TaxID=1798194 RepID=UPI0008E17DD9|nr:hypothetical protein [Collimonas sp. OK607]SFB04096.1 hypothetical protein SAMN04515620_11428 [Collimonas sp. OK607]